MLHAKKREGLVRVGLKGGTGNAETRNEEMSETGKGNVSLCFRGGTTGSKGQLISFFAADFRNDFQAFSWRFLNSATSI